MQQDPHYFQERGPEELAPVVSIGKWLTTMLLMYIPVVNLVLLILWAVSEKVNPNHKNLAIALLILVAISTILLSIVFGQLMAPFSRLVEGMI